MTNSILRCDFFSSKQLSGPNNGKEKITNNGFALIAEHLSRGSPNQHQQKNANKTVKDMEQLLDNINYLLDNFGQTISELNNSETAEMFQEIQEIQEILGQLNYLLSNEIGTIDAKTMSAIKGEVLLLNQIVYKSINDLSSVSSETDASSQQAINVKKDNLENKNTETSQMVNLKDKNKILANFEKNHSKTNLARESELLIKDSKALLEVKNELKQILAEAEQNNSAKSYQFGEQRLAIVSGSENKNVESLILPKDVKLSESAEVLVENKNQQTKTEGTSVLTSPDKLSNQVEQEVANTVDKVASNDSLVGFAKKPKADMLVEPISNEDLVDAEELDNKEQYRKTQASSNKKPHVVDIREFKPTDSIDAKINIETSLEKTSTIKGAKIEQNKNSQKLFESVASQMIENLKITIKNNANIAKITLKPENLGEMTIRLEVDGESISAKFTVQNESVKNLLESNVQALRQQLETIGLKPTRIEFSLESSLNYSQGDNSESQRYGQPSRFQSKELFSNYGLFGTEQDLIGSEQYYANASGVNYLI